RLDFLAGHCSGEMRQDRFQVESQLGVADNVVADSVVDKHRVSHAARSVEPMDPAESGEAHTPAPQLPELLVDVTLLAPEAAKIWMESRPGPTAAGKCAEA